MIRFTPITEERYNDMGGPCRAKTATSSRCWAVTVTARHIADVTKVVAEHGLNIDAIKRTHGPHARCCEDDRARQVVHRALGARIAHRRGTQHDAGGSS